MKDLIIRHSINLLILTCVSVGIYTALNWSSMPMLQRLVGLIFIMYAFHEFEEFKFPGGFTEMTTKGLDFSLPRPESAKLVVALAIFCIAFVPFFFTNIAWLAIAPMLLGILEVVAHFGMIKIFKLKRLYSPGMATALLMLPISIYSIYYVVQNDLIQPVQWLYAVVYMAVIFFIAQITVIKLNGLNYFEFVKNGRATVLARLKQQ
ncbi:MAG: HXXEE domain-containing protein [Desulfatitalea sp.]|nr:HXXEE domain-containing protein [Desulfatitalea sp.]NNK01599.1 HXXEE domain-containing protein [Desulfatitalea sp.]